jgi:hypothetical protein
VEELLSITDFVFRMNEYREFNVVGTTTFLRKCDVIKEEGEIIAPNKWLLSLRIELLIRSGQSSPACGIRIIMKY